MPGIRVGLLCLWPVPGHKFGAGGQSDCSLLWGWKGGKEEAMEEGCGQCHEKLMQSWCSLKVTLLLQQKERGKINK